MFDHAVTKLQNVTNTETNANVQPEQNLLDHILRQCVWANMTFRHKKYLNSKKNISIKK